MRRRLFLAGVVGLCTLHGCEKQKGAAAPTGERTIVIGYSQCNRAEPWREQMDKDIESSGAAHDGVRVVMKDAQNDVLRQVSHVREFISQKVDVLIISPKDVSLTTVVGEAFDAGIPVVVLDRGLDGEKYSCFIGADNRLIGAEVGKWLKDRFAGSTEPVNIVELRGLETSVPARDRSEPFREAIAGTNLTVVYDADMEWLADKAREKMQAALARFPEPGSIDVVYGANDPAAIAAFDAARDAGREAEIVFVGVDALPHEGINAVNQGILAASFEYPNGAGIAIETALKLARGEAVERTITLSTRLFTRDHPEGRPLP